MWVVKVGGSLEGAAKLPRLLTFLTQDHSNDFVIVPGGGRFADQIREEQAELEYDDATAHHKAIKAMEQYARVLCDLNSNLYPVTNLNELNHTGGNPGVPVWLPGKLLKQQTDIPMNWQVTSDSLALWLADALTAKGLVLMKPVPNNTAEINELARTGYLDGYFPEMIKKTNVKCVMSVCVENLDYLKQLKNTGNFPAEKLLHR